MEVFALFCAVVIAHSEDICDQPIDLNTATLSELDSLPYISSSAAQLIMDIRPICSPLELTFSPKKIIGITENRLNDKWNWFESKRCLKTCCQADASCPGVPPLLIPVKPAIYSWQTGPWSVCTSDCGKGKQKRDITCFDSSNNTIVDNKYCLTIPYKPIYKQLCNIMPCPIYKWIPLKWKRCVVDPNGICIKEREVLCYDTANNIIDAASKCDIYDKPNTIQTCGSCAHLRRAGSKKSPKRSLLSLQSTQIGDVTVYFDLFHNNDCETDMYRNIGSNTLIRRRGCFSDIQLHVVGLSDDDDIDMSWFYLDAELQADRTQTDNNEWYNNYLEWVFGDDDDDDTDHNGLLRINIPNDGYIGEFKCNLYFQRNGNEVNRQIITTFSLYILFNPYNSVGEVYMSSAVDRGEYIENEFGLIWYGSSDYNSAMPWNFDQFYFPNLLIAMDLLNTLELQYRNNLVLISRHISYAVQNICFGNWGRYPYTTGWPAGGYSCSGYTCTLEWTGTTQLFDVYRDELNYEYRVQYCQCFVYAGLSTTVGRALGIPTRPITNFQSAHDTDYNRQIDQYWVYNSDTGYVSKGSGRSHDSVWNFHAWNEMYFERNDFTNSAYNNKGWQVIDATPQETSYGGNPAISPNEGAYQLGPASLELIKDNKNPHECIDASLPSLPSSSRFGCFDNEFVISETNANYLFWIKWSPWYRQYELYDIYEYDPFDPEYDTIGALTNTKKPKSTNMISNDCLNEGIGDCDDEYLDLTLDYKKAEPSDPGTPTDTINVYEKGDYRTRRRRRRLWSEYDYSLDDLDNEGIEYRVITIPHKWYMTPMIIADDRDIIIDLYDNDYTFGMMSITMDSYHDNAFDVYCGFTLTAHDYTGKQLYLNNDNTTNGAVKNETYNFVLSAGESGVCQFYINYTEYSEWLWINSETPYAFKFAVSISLFDETIIDEQPYQIIIEQRDILICSPKLKLKDRIICAHKLKWFQPSNLEYECNINASADNNIGVGDGFCDEMNNINGCYDGGDCCKSTCVPSQNYKCPKIFNCIDDRIKYKKHNKNYKKCPKISSFVKYINYINKLGESSVCSDVIQNFSNVTCESDIFSTDTGNECINAILSWKGAQIFGKIENCFDETFNSLDIDQEMKQIVQVTIDCTNGQEKQAKKAQKKAPKKKVTKKKTSAFSVGFGNDGFSDNYNRPSNKVWYDFSRGSNIIVSIVIMLALIISIIICILYICKSNIINRKYEGMKKVSYDTEDIETDVEQYPINH